MRKIAVVTGTRAEYGLLKPIIQKIDQDTDLELKLIVTGTHLAKEFGNTVDDIIHDNVPIKAKINAYPLTDDGYGMLKAISDLLAGLVKEFKQDRPDIILILGDRGEPLAAAIAGMYLNIPVAHIHGGDVSGSVDESVRHAITKLSHIHFPATKASANRLIRLGELKENIYMVGAPGLDSILSTKFLSRLSLCKEIGLNQEKEIIVLLQHSVTTEYVPELAANHINSTLAAISRLKKQVVVIYPNSDAGGREMIKEIEKRSDDPNFKIFKNLPALLYQSLLKNASLLVGNSSSGIIEAPSYNLPVINIGNRQRMREQAGNVVDVEQNTEKIYQLAKRILEDKEYRDKLGNVKNPYGDGSASKKIVKVLKEIALTPELIQKRITY
ncbi:MAG: UDP-N-acetylglucosamine 2-epimerase [Candidatus Hodarchaeales archaeon]|jgi:UDP-N-acetylglucosamine 2-epimerase (non-hydrolysing)/GDP/UDP-N,N'-diacetylbacillosamine 2-epimerase (hydrolysing)